MADSTHYDDRRIKCDGTTLTIKWYYLWGAKKVPLRHIKSASTYILKPWRGKWRIWGTGDFIHWYNLDSSRPHKEAGIVLNLGGWIRPCITPNNVEEVMSFLSTPQ